MNINQLSYQQKIAYNKYIQGHNIFITGPGGTGKSALIKKIYLHALEHGKNIQVTALTGCAAILLGCEAKTLHSWAGIGLANKPTNEIVSSIIKNSKKKANWKRVDILVIDEVSMMSKKLFDLIYQIAYEVRKDYRPFGGMQVIFSGDFFQLPPVGNRDDDDTSKFCFESENWNKTFTLENQVQLVKIFRQKDEKYTDILNQVREGRIKKSSNNLLTKMVGKPIPENYIIKPTKLFPIKTSVEIINNEAMSCLSTEIIEYKIKKHYNLPILTKMERDKRALFNHIEIENELEYLILNSNFDTNLKLKIGAQVMCTINVMDEIRDRIIICNGSQGIIVKIDVGLQCPVVRFNNGLEMTMGYHITHSEKIPGIGISQVPLILAWAVTIHKSQGATLDAAEIDVGRGIFECGQTYVALSRVKSLEGLFLTSYDPTKIKINRKVKEYYEKLLNIEEPEDLDLELNIESVSSGELKEEIIDTEMDTNTNTNTSSKETNIFKNFEYKEEPISADNSCVVCLTNQRTHVIMPCRHLSLCGLCEDKCELCPICRGEKNQVISVINC